jgi:hypothetical protein
MLRIRQTENEIYSRAIIGFVAHCESIDVLSNICPKEQNRMIGSHGPESIRSYDESPSSKYWERSVWRGFPTLPRSLNDLTSFGQSFNQWYSWTQIKDDVLSGMNNENAIGYFHVVYFK